MSVKLTALIVTSNESKKLIHCLEALKQCDNIIVVDLHSVDNCVEIAKGFGAHVMYHDPVSVVEKVYPNIIEKIKDNWILKVDPDEVLNESLINDIRKCIQDDHRLGMIRLPHRYYFKKKPLYTTRWGTIKSSPKVFNKKRVVLSPYVHAWISLRDGYTEKRIMPTDKNVVVHYWADSWRELFRKHLRYIKKEGEAYYANGKRFLWRRLYAEVIGSLRTSFVTCAGWRGGFNGVFLSFFHAWYTAMSHMSLRKYEIDRKRIR